MSKNTPIEKAPLHVNRLNELMHGVVTLSNITMRLAAAAKEYREAVDHYNAIDDPGSDRYNRLSNAKFALDQMLKELEAYNAT